MADPISSDTPRIELYLDDASEPFAVHLPPARISVDTTRLTDGPHVLCIVAHDLIGGVGRRTVPFIVQNGPGITVSGLRENSRVAGEIEIDVNAFGANEPFDPVRAESSSPIPVFMWVAMTLIAAFGGWYGLAELNVPEAFAKTATYAVHPTAISEALAPAVANVAAKSSGKGAAAGFDYGATGGALYTQNCAACHGADGAGVPSVFPALARDAVVTGTNPHDQIVTVLHGLHGKTIAGKSYTAQMPAFPQLTDDDIAAIIDHERTSWENDAPTITPGDVRRLR